MNVDQVYAILRSGEEDPRPALQWALEHWDEASDRLLSKLRALAAKLPDDCNSDAYDEADAAALHALMHLFAEKRDVRAYGPVCKRLLGDIEISAWLGNDVEKTLTGVFINLYDGDIAPLVDMVMRAEGDEYVRAAAFEAYSYLVRMTQAASEDEARAVLERFVASAEPREPDHIWTEWALAVARLGFADMSPEVARVFSKSWISDNEMTLQDYHHVLAVSRADPAAAFSEDEIKPFESAIALFERKVWDDQEGADEDSVLRPHVNEMRDVGRNDPCPCGSGKKYKKCCLAA